MAHGALVLHFVLFLPKPRRIKLRKSRNSEITSGNNGMISGVNKIINLDNNIKA